MMAVLMHTYKIYILSIKQTNYAPTPKVVEAYTECAKYKQLFLKTSFYSLVNIHQLHLLVLMHWHNVVMVRFPSIQEDAYLVAYALCLFPL